MNEARGMPHASGSNKNDVPDYCTHSNRTRRAATKATAATTGQQGQQ